MEANLVMVQTLLAHVSVSWTYIVNKVAEVVRVVGRKLWVVASHDFVHEALHISCFKGVLVGVVVG
jgi:hypothetical protein